MFLASMLTKNFSPGCRYPRTDAVNSNSFRDQKLDLPLGTAGKSAFHVSQVESFAMSANQAMNLL
jgi:hypothetical protein